jgi:hypothetical protein
MRANRAFELLVSRDGREPAFLADRRRLDRLEVVSVETGEVVFFWELPVRAAAKLERQLRADLAAMEAGAFVDRWSRDDVAGGRPL